MHVSEPTPRDPAAPLLGQAAAPSEDHGRAVLTAAQLAPRRLPSARGALSEFLVRALSGAPGPVSGWPAPDDDAFAGEDGALSLYCLYELHYRGFAGVDERWEWEPSLLALRAELEEDLEPRLRHAAGPDRDLPGPPRGIAGALTDAIDRAAGPSLSSYLAQDGSLEQFREFAVHRSLLQLKEADPHSWAIPRLAGRAKAALVEIQADEYGDGVEEEAHQNLFGLTMLALGLDPAYNRYLDVVPGPTLATVNLPSFLGLHRRLRGALVGHLAVFEMTSVTPMRAYASGLRRHGLAAQAARFFDVHVVADAHHQNVASESLAGGLVRAEPCLARDILFGARAALAVEGRCAEAILAAWRAGRSSLRHPEAGARGATVRAGEPG